jgi:hypothetical protein
MIRLIFIFLTLPLFAQVPTQTYNDATVIVNSADIEVTSVSSQKLPRNLNRKYLLIVNKGTQIIYVKYDSAHTGTEGIPIPVGGNYEPWIAPTNAIFMRSASGSQNVQVTEGQ